MTPFSKQRNHAVKMCQLFHSENDPRDLHRRDFQHCTTRHHIEPNLAHLLCLCNRHSNSSNNDQQCADTANNSRQADERKQSRCTAAVNGMLNGLVQSIPRRRKATYYKSEHQQNCAPAPPILNAGAIHNRPANKTQRFSSSPSFMLFSPSFCNQPQPWQ